MTPRAGRDQAMKESTNVKRLRIAIDGPGGAGKSTVAKRLAEDLKLFYLDTGAMYRCCALKAQRLGVDCRDAAAVEAMMRDIDIDVLLGEDGPVLSLDGAPVGEEIRRPEISMLASDISAIPACRSRLTAIQQELARRCDLVMDGRDIGTVVIPDAELKIFLTAGQEERARRRYEELLARGREVDYASILDELRRRDHQDSNRPVAPLRQAEDAHRVDSDALDVEGVVACIKALLAEAERGRPT